MKKLSSTWYNMSIVLTLISLCAGVTLAYVNDVTKGPIKQIKEENDKLAIKQVLNVKEISISDTIKMASGKDTIYVYKTDAGMAVKSIDPDNASFGGGLTVMVGFDQQGVIQGYSVTETNETPGLGAKAGEWFQKGNKGDIIGKDMSTYPEGLHVTKDKGDFADADVDAITASTITSRSFLRAINVAYQKCVEAQKDGADAQSSATSQSTK